jgi:hypothetical protein
MIKGKLSDMYRGWCVGDFEPSLLRTKDFEVGVLLHPKGEKWPKHYHKEAIEINVLISGKMIINGKSLTSGDILITFSVLSILSKNVNFLLTNCGRLILNPRCVFLRSFSFFIIEYK